MTIVWIGLIVIGIVLIIGAFTVGDYIPVTDGAAYMCVVGVIASLAGIICFFVVPVHGYMEVDSIHWNWSVDIFTYSAVRESDRTGHRYTRSGAEEEARGSIPTGAYDIHIETHSGSREVVDREWKDENGNTHKETHKEYYYYADYSYTIDKWIKTSEVSVCGRDKNPYEPERPFDTTAPDVLGNQKCGMGHNELYTVTGLVDGEMHTYNISRSDWEHINENDEFGYKKYRFGDTIWDLQIAQ